MLLSRFFAHPTKTRKPVDSIRPQIDLLEDRWCPAHVSLNAQVLPGHLVQLSGTVTDTPLVAGISVAFCGATYGTATTDGSGNYSYTTSSASLGNVYAYGVVPGLNVSTDTAQAAVAVAAPSLTLGVTAHTAGTLTVSGHLTAMDNAGKTVNITGVVQGSVTTDSSGDFSLTASPSGTGQITASETDTWGLTGSTSISTSTGPVIEDFTAVRGIGNWFTFTGRVIDAYTEGLIVRLGGLTSLAGLTATVQEDGSFTLTCEIADYDIGGTGSAVTTDWWGIESNTALTVVG